MSSDHYFSDAPSSAFTPRTITVTLAQREVQVTTSGGIFSPEHIDRGTQVLLEHGHDLPNSGNLLDLGCGWGPIALSLALAAPDATVWAVDVNERALELTRLNAEQLSLKNIRTAHPDQVPEEISFAAIWSNPPIRVGKAALHQMLMKWLPRLQDGCEAQLVVAKKLGSDSLLQWMRDTLIPYGASERTANKAGFRVLTFTRIVEQ
jgi:16S rRNA G1207 methylase RsmC